jgi:hypothetical protein
MLFPKNRTDITEILVTSLTLPPKNGIDVTVARVWQLV